MIHFTTFKKSNVFALFTVALVWGGLYGYAAGQNFSQTPVLSVREPAKDVGTMVEGTIIRHTFLLHNNGSLPLVIERVAPGCSCTRVVHDPVVRPRRNSYLRVQIDTTGQTGTWTKSIVVFSNDPCSPQTRLTISARILKSVCLVPDRVFFNGTTGRAMAQVVEVKAPDHRPFKLTIKQSKLSGQAGFYLEQRPQDNSWLVHIRHKAETPDTSRGEIVLATDIAHRPQIVIPVLSRISAPVLSRFPDRIDFGKVTRSAVHLPMRSINLKYLKGRPPVVRCMGGESDRFDIKMVAIKDLGILRLEFVPRMACFEPGVYEDCLGLVMAVPANEKLSIPVRLELK